MQKKRYWLASVACLVVIVALVIGFWIYHPEFKILLLYGVFQIFNYLIFLIANIVIPSNLSKMMFYNQVIFIIETFIFVLILGGIMHSGGLIFIGFFVVLFTLDIQSRKNVKWLFGIYIVTLILAAILQPWLTTAREMTPRANLTLFVFNLAWISTFAFVFILDFISQLVGIEKKETARLKEWDKIKTDLYTNITHEFRTPLTVIRGMANLIRDEPDKWLHTGTLKIDNNVDTLLNLVNQMLDLSKLEAGAMPVHNIQGDVVLYIRYLVESLHSMTLNKKITFRYLPETDQVIMDYDPEKLMQIVSNLVSNAIKYTHTRGVVELRTKLTEGAEKKLEIKVKDNGIGIREEDVSRIFDRFYRVDKHEKSSTGTGLGLSLTLELIKLLKGTVSVESVFGEGTEFTVLLPVTNNATLLGEGELPEVLEKMKPDLGHFESKRPVPVSNEFETEDKPLLLIVEDNNDVIDYLSAILGADYRVALASDGKKGWAKALQIVPDIVLTDIMMPEMDGIELLEKLKNDIHTSHIPVVVLTAKADVASRLKGLKTGADAYLAKPFIKEELQVQLDKLILLRKKLHERYADIGTCVEVDNKKFSMEDSFIKTVRQHMLNHLCVEEFNVQELCREVGMGRSNLYSKFKHLTNRAIFEYFHFLRLHKAKELLLKSDANVSEAAFKTGFKNISHFSRAFTKEFGVNPSKIHDSHLPS